MKKLGIVASFLKLANLGEEGKVLSFFGKVEASLEKQIEKVEFNFTHDKFLLESKINDLQNRIEDSKEEFEYSFLNVELDNIKTKQNQEDFVDTYLTNIRNKELNLQNLENELKDLKVKLKESLDNKNETIKRLKSRLEKLVTGVDVSNVIDKK